MKPKLPRKLKKRVCGTTDRLRRVEAKPRPTWIRRVTAFRHAEPTVIVHVDRDGGCIVYGEAPSAELRQ